MILKFLFLFGLGYITVLYLYLPRWYQKRLKHAPVIGNLLTHQEIHHVEHRNKTQEDHIEKAGKYIKKSLESGHELFVTVQHLEEKGYSVEEIETAVQKVVPDEALWKGLDHYKHYHHNKHIINALKNYIKKEYEKKELKEIIKEILNKKFTEQEIIQALKFTAKKPKKLKSKSIAKELDKNWKELNNIIIKAEARNVDFSKIHGSFYFVKKKEGAILAENVADYIVHKYSKFSEFVEHLRMFKFTEEDLRVALRYIKPKNAYDEEIIKWV